LTNPPQGQRRKLDIDPRLLRIQLCRCRKERLGCRGQRTLEAEKVQNSWQEAAEPSDDKHAPASLKLLEEAGGRGVFGGIVFSWLSL